MGNYTVSKKAFFFFLLIVGFHSLLGKILGFFLPVYFEGLGFSGVQTGIYFTFASISTVILSLPMGVSTDNKPIAYIFMLSFFLIGFGYLGLIISRSFFIICSFAFMGSFGTHFFSIASQSMFFKITGNKSPVQAGLYNLSNFFFMGTGMILGGVIIAGFSYKHAFILAFSVNVILIILSFFVPRTETVKITIEEYKKAIFRSDILFLVFIFFLSACHWGAENVAYAKFLKHNLFLSKC